MGTVKDATDRNMVKMAEETGGAAFFSGDMLTLDARYTVIATVVLPDDPATVVLRGRANKKPSSPPDTNPAAEITTPTANTDQRPCSRFEENIRMASAGTAHITSVDTSERGT